MEVERLHSQEETKRLLAEAGTRGVLLGKRDCTVPDDFELERVGLDSSGLLCLE